MSVRSVHNAKGSITVFTALSMTLIASLMFALMESARVCGMKGLAEQVRISAAESVLSGYSDWIFKNYDIFLLDGGFGESELNISKMDEKLLRYSTLNLDPYDDSFFGNGKSFYKMQTESAQVTEYLLATDDSGEAFRNLAVSSWRSMMLLSEAQDIYDALSRSEDEINNMPSVDEVISESKNTVKEEKKAAREAAKEAKKNGTAAKGKSKTKSNKDTPSNPVDTYDKVSRKSTLNLVVPTGTALSSKKIPFFGRVSDRIRNAGNMRAEYDTDWLDIAVFNSYIGEHFTCYGKTEKTGVIHALDYELEYILGGKTSDTANLKYAVAELLAVREAANMMYLEGDSIKQEAALALAAAILAPTGVGEAGVAALEQGILASWAFAESILDIRALMAGRKISWIKDSVHWTTDIDSISTVLNGNTCALNCENGADYEEYIQKLIYLKSRRTLSLRTMDLIEQNYRQSHNADSFCMDNAVVAIKADFSYGFDRVFLQFVTVGNKMKDDFTLDGSTVQSYLM